MSNDAEHFDRDGDDPPETSKKVSWIEQTLVPKLRERPEKSIAGDLLAPYIDKECYRPVSYTLSLVDKPDEIEIHANVTVDGFMGQDRENFVVRIARENGTVNVWPYSTQEPGCFEDRMMWILYAAAGLWNLLPAEARPRQ